VEDIAFARDLRQPRARGGRSVLGCPLMAEAKDLPVELIQLEVIALLGEYGYAYEALRAG
jgi:hypothetical protein